VLIAVVLIVGVLLAVTGGSIVGIVALARGTHDRDPSAWYIVGIVALFLFGLAGAAGLGCTAFVVLGS
jgi:hypothetical protein